jgi:DHA1 family multidrug resistance protein-like MFS transporter
MKIKINIDIKINRVIKFLVLSDLLFLGSWSLIQPIFAVFILEKVSGASLVTVGFVAGIYWLVKSLLQIPVANFLDRTEGEKDDFYALMLALVLAAVASFSFAFISKIWQLFLIQFIYAVSMGLYVPSWSGIFSRHLDEKRFSFDWSLDSTLIGLVSFFSAVLGGVLASWFGFPFIFFLVGIFSLGGAFLLFMAPNLIIPKAKKIEEAMTRDHSPADINR